MKCAFSILILNLNSHTPKIRIVNDNLSFDIYIKKKREEKRRIS